MRSPVQQLDVERAGEVVFRCNDCGWWVVQPWDEYLNQSEAVARAKRWPCVCEDSDLPEKERVALARLEQGD